MKRILIMVAMLAGCSGCGSPKSGQESQVLATNHGFGYEYNDVNSSGLRVRYEDGFSPRIEIVDQWFNDTVSCIEQHSGISIPSDIARPLVLYVPSTALAKGIGITYFDTGTVLVSNAPAETNPVQMRVTTQHEFVHWITGVAGLLTNDQQLNHDSTLFMTCVVV